jgi:hypothetical protein
LAESRTKSRGRMSAPFQEPASSASKTPHATNVQMLVRGTCGTGMEAKTIEGVCVFTAYSLGWSQGSQLFVNISQLGLFFRRAQAGVGLKLVAGLEQLQLANGRELGIGGWFET